MTAGRTVRWADLGRGARAWRVVHGAWSMAGLASLGYVWWCALARRRDARLGASVGFLLVEGVALAIGGGNCPLGPMQDRLGDPVPFFELVLPPRAAKAAIPILFWASVAGLVAVLARPPAGSPAAGVAGPGGAGGDHARATGPA